LPERNGSLRAAVLHFGLHSLLDPRRNVTQSLKTGRPMRGQRRIAARLEFPMKKIALAAALSLAATTAFAGGVAEPVMEEEVVAAATSSSASGVIVPLLLLLIVAAAVSSSSGGGESL
jgi:hypothetical protein